MVVPDGLPANTSRTRSATDPLRCQTLHVGYVLEHQKRNREHYFLSAEKESQNDSSRWREAAYYLEFISIKYAIRAKLLEKGTYT